MPCRNQSAGNEKTEGPERSKREAGEDTVCWEDGERIVGPDPLGDEAKWLKTLLV